MGRVQWCSKHTPGCRVCLPVALFSSGLALLWPFYGPCIVALLLKAALLFAPDFFARCFFLQKRRARSGFKSELPRLVVVVVFPREHICHGVRDGLVLGGRGGGCEWSV